MREGAASSRSARLKTTRRARTSAGGPRAAMKGQSANPTPTAAAPNAIGTRMLRLFELGCSSLTSRAGFYRLFIICAGPFERRDADGVGGKLGDVEGITGV